MILSPKTCSTDFYRVMRRHGLVWMIDLKINNLRDVLEWWASFRMRLLILLSINTISFASYLMHVDDTGEWLLSGCLVYYVFMRPLRPPCLEIFLTIRLLFCWIGMATSHHSKTITIIRHTRYGRDDKRIFCSLNGNHHGCRGQLQFSRTAGRIL